MLELDLRDLGHDSRCQCKVRIEIWVQGEQYTIPQRVKKGGWLDTFRIFAFIELCELLQPI